MNGDKVQEALALLAEVAGELQALIHLHELNRIAKDKALNQLAELLAREDSTLETVGGGL